MSLTVRTADLVKLNALTRYPSILTYHALDPRQSRSRGKHEEPKPLVRFSGTILVTEKVDGVNARVVVTGDGSYLIGSREEFLYASGDLLHNPAMSIVDTVRPVADQLVTASRGLLDVVVWFGEVYGGKVTDGSRQYTGEQRLGFRLFDVAILDDALGVMSRPVEQIGAWREGGGQGFVPETELQRLAAAAGQKLTPRITEIEAEELPQGLQESLEFLEDVLSESRATLDVGAGGRPEGVVLRSPDRKAIAKLRFRDYRELCKGKKREESWTPQRSKRDAYRQAARFPDSDPQGTRR
jgi:hypothetical protein